MINFVGRRYWYFLLSALIIVPGLISMLIPPAFKPGIEFTSGSTMTIQFANPVDQSQLRAALAQFGQGDAIIQHTGEGSYLIRTRELKPEQKDAQGNVTVTGERETLEAKLRADFGNLDVQSFDSVSPIVATEIVRNATFAVLAATIGILLYITWAFRKVPNPFRYGVSAVVALLHDALVVLGLFSIFGKLFNIEIDSMFITGLLTVIGFSVHDTIVVFDRIRENLKRGLGLDFSDTVNHSLTETLGRSITTSLTVVFTLLALFLFGGVTIRNFVLVLLIGIVSGTFSSIFNASQLLVVWENGELGALFHRIPFVQTTSKGNA